MKSATPTTENTMTNQPAAAILYTMTDTVTGEEEVGIAYLLTPDTDLDALFAAYANDEDEEAGLAEYELEQEDMDFLDAHSY